MAFPIIIEDALKRKVYLAKERWDHITKEHPIAKRYLSEIEETINISDIITKSNYDKEILLYYKFYKNIFSGKFIIVVVKHDKYRSFLMEKRCNTLALTKINY